MIRPMTRWTLAAWLTIGLIVAANGQDGGETVDDVRERATIARFVDVLEKAPRRGTALDRVYGYHVERGSLDGFLEAYRRKAAADPKDGASRLILGLIESQRGRDASAVAAFREAEAARPDDPLPPYYLGQALVLVGQVDLAAEAFERALTRKPTRVDLLDIYQALGRVHQRAHRDDKALAVWDRLERAFPDDARVREQVARSLAEEGQEAQALPRFEALAKSTTDPFRRAQFALEAAEIKGRTGRSPEALADLEGLLGRLDPSSWLGREVRRRIEDLFTRSDDLAGLSAYYERWIGKNPDDVEAMARLGRVLADQGRAADARGWLDRAVKLAPLRRELRLALIEGLVRERKFAEAASQYEALAKSEPNNPDVVRDWGRMLLRDSSRPEIERKRAASAVWRRLAPEDSKDPVAIAQVADLSRQAGMVDEAIGLYRRAVALAPDASQYREYLGEYHHALKRPADALAAWRSMAEGPRRSSKSLGRLGEVLANFGFREEAVGPLVEACRIEPDDFDFRLRLADLRLALDQSAEALAELDRASNSARGDEQAGAVLDRQIRAHQAGGTLAVEADRLRKGLESAPTAAGWSRLARFLEADGKPPEAARAIGEALRLDPKSPAAWSDAARLRESAGDLLGAADSLRALARLDRRSRPEALGRIARLEARLGRQGPALEAGRDLLAAAPGNPEVARDFAELCFTLGRVDEGLDVLRRAARSNPSDPRASITLAEALARLSRTDEAIELYWRAFARTVDLEAKLGLVARLADLHLQANQLDRLLSRLARELREPDRRRDLALCLARAHSAAGDSATARQELERLLATEPRDVPLLTQLSALAEQDGDTPAAARYARLALDIAPGPEAEARLAQLYLGAGDYDEAEAIWSRSGAEGDPGRALASVDALLAVGKHEAALRIAAPGLRDHPDDWEWLVRGGVALAGLGRLDEADRRFLAVLDLKGLDDARGRIAGPNRPAGTPSARPSTSTLPIADPPIRDRLATVAAVRAAARLDQGNPSSRLVTTAATRGGPSDFGQGRVAALGWRLALSRRNDAEAAFLAERRAARDRAPDDPRALWDWYYLQIVRQDDPETFRAALALASRLPSDLSSRWALLASIGGRAVPPGQPRTFRAAGSTAIDPTPPLAAEEIAQVLDCYRGAMSQRPDLTPLFLGDVLAELTRAGRPDEATRLYREAIAAAALSTANIAPLLNAAANRGDADALATLAEKAGRVSGPASIVAAGNAAFARALAIRGRSKDVPAMLAILDRALAANSGGANRTVSMGRGVGSAGRNQGRFNLAYWTDARTQRAVAIDFPTPDGRFGAPILTTLRTAFEAARKADALADLFAHLEAKGGEGPRADRLMALAYLRWWADEKDGAAEAMAAAVEAAGADPGPRLALADLLELQGEPAEALAAVDAIESVDPATVLARETAALRLAVASGEVGRARLAAERLFGLRLDAEAQGELADLMRQLGMHDLAEAVLARARRSAGNKASSLLILLNQYEKQGKADLALQVARQIIRTRPVGPAGRAVGTPDDEPARQQAIRVLSEAGGLKELIARAEAQLERSPNSIQVLQALADYAEAANDRERLRAIRDRIGKARPDDPRHRLEIANLLARSGEFATAIDHYRAAIRLDPSPIGPQFQVIYAAFQRANRAEEFSAILDGLDLRALGNAAQVAQIVHVLMIDPGGRDRGLALFRRAWTTFRAERADLVSLLGTSIGDRPGPDQAEVFGWFADYLIPGPGALASPWWGADQVLVRTNDGRVALAANRWVELAATSNRLDALIAQLRSGLADRPDWRGGRAILAVALLRAGKYDEARPIVLEAMADASGPPIPAATRSMIAQELEDHSPVRELAVGLLEKAAAEALARPGLDLNDPSTTRLLAWYRANGRSEQARALLLKLAAARRVGPVQDPGYLEAVRIGQMGGHAGQLAGLGFAADAVRVYRDQIEAAAAAGGDGPSGPFFDADSTILQARQGIRDVIAAAKAAAVPSAVAEMLRPRGKGGLDLAPTLTSNDFEGSGVAEPTVEAIRKLVGTGGNLPAEVAEALEAVRRAGPDDVGTLAVLALVDLTRDDARAVDGSTSRLIGAIDRAPLDPIRATSTGRPGRPTAIQRAEAARRLVVWLVARDCLARADLKGRGDQLASIALEAADRQLDPRWSAVVLRDWGRMAIDRGDREGGERRWSDLLDRIVPPALKKEARATPAEGFDRALGLARLATDRGLTDLSIRAVRAAFRGGMPPGLRPSAATPMGAAATWRQISTNRARRSGFEAAADATATGSVQARLADLEASWARDGASPRAIYEVLRDVVLPPARPGEVDLYPGPLTPATANRPRSVAARLASRAAEVGATEGLRAEARSRRGRPSAELAGLALVVEASLAAAEPAAASAALVEIQARMARDGLASTAELAARAALPALGVPGATEAAESTLDRAIKDLSARSTAEPLGTLILALAGREFDRGRPVEGSRRHDEFLALQEKAFAQSDPTFMISRRKLAGHRVASDLAARGLAAEALERLGPFVDGATTRYADPNPAAVLAAMARALPKLPASDRYRRLKDWTFPTPTRKTIRSLVGIPPEPGDVASTFGWLVEAAKEAGKLDELTTEARAQVTRGVEAARPLLAMADRARGNGEEAARIADMMAGMIGNPSVASAPNQGSIPAAGAFLAARALMADPSTRPSGMRLARAVVDGPIGQNLAGGAPIAAIKARLGRDLDRAEVARLGGSDRPIGRGPALAWWRPADPGLGAPLASTTGPAWASRSGHVGLSAPDDPDSLVFAFPLAGRFEFAVDASAHTSEGEAALAFGGLAIDSRPPGPARAAHRGLNRVVANPAATRATRSEGFNRIVVRVEPGRVSYAINGVLLAEDREPSPTSPWLALIGRGRASWRSLELGGSPEIPSEVRLSHADRLDGWSAATFGESKAPRVAPGVAAPGADPSDWASRDGVILGRRLDASSGLVDAQSLLAYARSIGEGESVSYEFLHEPGRTEVHPALGRTAFLLGPDGVRIHRLTEESGLEASGLIPGNVADDPIGRRGPGPVPIKPNAWNSARLAIDGGKMTLAVNGEVVYERPVGPDDDSTFGLFHWKDRTVVRVRDVVLRGDWPARFEAARGSGLLAPASPPSEADRLSAHARIGEGTFVMEAGAVLDRARSMPPSARFDALADWVLPGLDHPTFRLNGRFSPLDPAPSAGSPPLPAPGGRTRVHSGGVPEAPAVDLVAIARESGRLDELIGRIESSRADSPVDARGRLALLAMARLTRGRDIEAARALAELRAGSASARSTDPEWTRWPELLAARAAAETPGARELAVGALKTASPEIESAVGLNDLWTRQVRQARALADASAWGIGFGDDPGIPGWAPASRARAALRSSGSPRAWWVARDGEWSRESGSRGDALIARVPIRGDFEASAELSMSPGREANLGYAGLAVRPLAGGGALASSLDDQSLPQSSIEPPLDLKGDWAVWKLTSRAGRLTIAVDGRTVLDRPIPPDSAPWLVVNAPGMLGCSVRKFALTGQPIAPEVLRINGPGDGPGWTALEYDESTGDPNSGWRRRGDEIVGHRSADNPSNLDLDDLASGYFRRAVSGQPPPPAPAWLVPPAPRRESVLRYRRPMLEDGTFAFEFFHETGRAAVHPSLDRMAFLLGPDGVKVHRLTDGPLDRAGLDPANAEAEPANRRGPATLPLKDRAWNRLEFHVVGDVLSIALNGTAIYERPIEPSNLRTFGLFHYADESEARVRDLTYRGQWGRAWKSD